MPSTTQPNSAAPVFVGEFSHSLDGKSRVTIPSDWRYESEAEFFLTISSGRDCVKAMTRAEIERIRAEAAEMPGPKRSLALRMLGAGTRQCRLDKAGRLVVPDEFCKELKLSGEVALLGAYNCIEIWNAAERAIDKPASEAAGAQIMADLGL